MARRKRSCVPVPAPTTSAGPAARCLQHTSPLTAAEEADKDQPIHTCSIDGTYFAPHDNTILRALLCYTAGLCACSPFFCPFSNIAQQNLMNLRSKMVVTLLVKKSLRFLMLQTT